MLFSSFKIQITEPSQDAICQWFLGLILTRCRDFSSSPGNFDDIFAEAGGKKWKGKDHGSQSFKDHADESQVRGSGFLA